MAVQGSPLGAQQRLALEVKRSAAPLLAEPRHDVTPAQREATAVERATMLGGRPCRLAPVELARGKRCDGVGIGNGLPRGGIPESLEAGELGTAPVRHRVG